MTTLALRRYHGDGTPCSEKPALFEGDLSEGSRYDASDKCSCVGARKGRPYYVVEKADPNGLDDWTWLPEHE